MCIATIRRPELVHQRNQCIRIIVAAGGNRKAAGRTAWDILQRPERPVDSLRGDVILEVPVAAGHHCQRRTPSFHPP